MNIYYVMIVSIILSVPISNALAQDTASHEFREVQVTGFKEERKNATSINITSITTTEMRGSGAFNIADGLAKQPGISQLSTGLAISKPVIRGLYGNRILTLLSGLRFDNQQWQDEHGLGLSDMGIDRVEVIKGPLAILYGTDAVGGILNVIEEKKAIENTLAVEYNFRFNSNTLGGNTEIGIKGNRKNKWWRVRMGAEANADYEDGKGTRVLNSRFNGVSLKGSFGLAHKRWISENNYSFSRNNFGFILNDIYTFLKPDSRYSYDLSSPHHTVMLHIFSSQNTWSLRKGLLKLNAGFQSNQRQEDEGGGAISINMLLSTLQYNLQWLRPIDDKVELIVSHASSFENNTNFGRRLIIPDANLFETSLSAFLKFRLPHVIIEVGAGINDKYINTLITTLVNTPDRPIQPFAQNRIAGNGIIGLTYNPNEHWNVKLNVASGLRAPNLAELSINGLHEGIFTYEIGDPNLKNEQNLNTDLSFSYTHLYFRVGASAFYNQFFNYIYLLPTSENILGFPTYRFRQQNAYLTGGEVEYEVTPQGVMKGLEWSQNFGGLVAIATNGNRLPFIAPPRISSTLRYSHDVSKRIKSMHGSIGFDYVFEQYYTAPLETPTPSYHLLNVSYGMQILTRNGAVKLSLIANNLLGMRYYDHLSRFKSYGLYNIGRNIILQVAVPLSFPFALKSKNK